VVVEEDDNEFILWWLLAVHSLWPKIIGESQ